MPTLEEIIGLVKKDGYAIIPAECAPEFEKSINEYISWHESCEELRPRMTSDSNSYSGRYGLSEFPLHTDFATTSIPPRLLSLYCQNAGPDACLTMLLPIRKLPRDRKSVV